MATPGIAMQPMASAPPLNKTYGSVMLGTFFGLILYGFTLHQGYRYVRLPTFRGDPLYVKGTVILVLVLETWITAVAMHTVYYYLVTNYSNPPALYHGVWSFNLLAFSTGIIIAVVQSFFARQLWLIDRRFRLLVALIVLLLACEAAVTLGITIEAFLHPNLNDFESFSWLVNAGLGMVIAADALLTTLLTIVLRRSRTGFLSTDSMLNVLIMYTINTGLLTGTLSIVSFLLAICYPDALYADGMNMCIAKLYANSLLAVLNSRQFVKSRGKQGGFASPPRAAVLPEPTSFRLHSAEDSVTPQGTADSGEAIEMKVTQNIVHDGSAHQTDLEHGNECFELERLPSGLSVRRAEGSLSALTFRAV